MKSRYKSYLIPKVFDLFLLNLSFFTMHFFKYGTLDVSAIHNKLLCLINLIWLFLLYINPKSMQNNGFLRMITQTTKSYIMFMAIVSFAIVAFQGMTKVSRFQVYGFLTLFYIFEVLSCVIYSIYVRKKVETSEYNLKLSSFFKTEIALSLLVADAIFVFLSFLIMTWLKRGYLKPPDEYYDIIFILYGLWLLSAVMTHKFDRNHFTSIYRSIGPCIKSFLFIAGGMAIMVFGLRLFNLSRLQIFGAIGILFILEVSLFYLYHIYRKYGGNIKDIENASEIHTFAMAEEDCLMNSNDENCIVKDPAQEKLKHALEFFDPKLFNFINESIDLSNIDRNACALLSTDDIVNIQIQEQNKLKLFVNIHKVNDMRWFNRYFLAVHSILTKGGYFIGYKHTINTHWSYFSKKYDGYLFKILYPIDFMWRRVFPKLPWLKKVYFSITKGRNRIVSKAEILGRLYFCGFKIVAEKEMDNRFYFIAQKVKPPSVDESPTYGPLVKLKRFGANNHPITVYKFRTMYPYSEYLQEYIYEMNQIDKGGKFRNDFRVTSWGRVMRKLWLDELPMIYNWLKGDLQLLGVRPLSKQYLGLYSNKLKRIRAMVKPGLIPPFYADLPKTLEEIEESELKYIESFLKKPFITQWFYFWKCFGNIVIKRARSA